MGHQIGKKSTPRRGSMQYWPLTRTDRAYHNFPNFGNLESGELSGFGGYKVGMRSVVFVDSNKNSPTFKSEVITSATIIECPPLFVCAVRSYGKLGVVGEAWAEGLNKNLKRRASFKEKNADIETLKEKGNSFRLLVNTQPWLINLKKTPELFEIAIGGDRETQFNKAKELFGKQLEVSSAIKDGTFIDVSSVTKGQGFSGSVKRYGVKIYPVHASKSRRKAGNLGAESMAKVQFTVPQHGRLGFNSRVEYNKFVFKIIRDSKEANISSGYTRYGNISSSALVLKGSVPGSTGRLIILRKALRPIKKSEPVKATLI